MAPDRGIIVVLVRFKLAGPASIRQKENRTGKRRRNVEGGGVDYFWLRPGCAVIPRFRKEDAGIKQSFGLFVEERQLRICMVNPGDCR